MKARGRKVFISMVLIMLTFTSCSKGSSDTSSSGKANDGNRVSVFHRWPEQNGMDVMKDVFDGIKDKCPDINLNVDCVPGDMYEVQLTVRLASDDAPDIFASWPGGRIESFVKNGTAKDITDLWDEGKFDDIFIPAVSKGCTHFDGKKYVVPMNVMPNTIYYSVKIFDELNLKVPETWDELMNCCEKIKESGTTPFVVGAQGARWGLGLWFDYFLLNTAGGEFRENLMQGKERWDSEEVYTAFETWKKMIDLGYFNKDFAAIDPNQIPTSYIAQGKAAMMLNGPWSITNLGNIDLVAGKDFNSFTFPQISKDIEGASEGCIEAWAVNANTKSYDACKQILKEFVSKDMMDLYTKEKVITNPRKDVSFDTFNEGTKFISLELKPQYENKTLYNNFELATIPAMQEAGLNAFVEFMESPDTYKDICKRLQQTSEEEFK